MLSILTLATRAAISLSSAWTGLPPQSESSTVHDHDSKFADRLSALHCAQMSIGGIVDML